jgi:NADH-quinone oxidoreductase subunit F
VPCRVGTKRQEEILERMFQARNGDSHGDVMLLSDIAQAMRDASICGLGQTAANAIASGLTQLKVLNG